jgi:hypothetical protein
MTGLLLKTNKPINGGTYRKKVRWYDVPKRKLRWPRLTVCIAMIIEKGGSSTIVFTADRMVSSDNKPGFDKAKGKIDELRPNAYVLTSSNDALLSDEIIIKTQKKLEDSPEPNLSVEQIVNTLSEECKLKFEAEIEEIRKPIFSRYHLTPDELKFKSKKMSDYFLKCVDDDLRQEEYEFKRDYFGGGAKFLIVGIDDAPHIYIVNHLGKITPYDHIGFAVVGSGERLAFPEITRLEEYTPDKNFLNAIVTVYNAKKRAERMTSVGEITDLWLLRKEGDNVLCMISKDFFQKQLDKNIDAIRKYEAKHTLNMINKHLCKNPISECFEIYLKIQNPTNSKN